MQSQIDPDGTAKFFMDIKERFASLQHGFAEFRDRLQAVGEKNPYFDWKVSPLAESRQSFELKYLTIKVRAVLSVRPSVDLSGVISFYRLDEFDATAASKIDSFTFEGERGITNVKLSSGADLSVVVEKHVSVLMLAVLRKACESEVDDSSN